jgi:retron-type reverse transcriptase
MLPESSDSLIKRCARATGMTVAEVIRIASLGPKRYKVYAIPKRSGGDRIICHPSRELKALQYVFLREILADLPVHDAATAYKSGSSIKQNASAHKSSRVILKLDFESFFPSIKARDWMEYVKSNIPHWSTDDISFSQYVMFWGAGSYTPDCLSIGAPTSPLISNVLMRSFDEEIAKFCLFRELIYTRYADDITISSSGYIDRIEVMSHVTASIANLHYPILKLNNAKTRLASKSTSRRVTGLVIANDGTISLGRDRKRLISAMVHAALSGNGKEGTRASLAGLLSFARDVEPKFLIALETKYGKQAVNSLQLRALD